MKSNKNYISSLIFLTIFSVVMIFTIYFLTSKERKLPIYNPVDVNPRLVDSKVKHISKGHKIAAFNLINQNGQTISQKNYENKIYVADFFFTRCKTICPIMSTNMATLQNKFLKDDDVLFLSMSVTPIMDSVSVLKKYAIKKGIIDKKWNLTTGKKQHIYELARKSFMAVLDEGDGDEQDFIHTEQFILVDKKKQIRGFYDGTNKEDIQQLIKDINLLKGIKANGYNINWREPKNNELVNFGKIIIKNEIKICGEYYIADIYLNNYILACTINGKDWNYFNINTNNNSMSKVKEKLMLKFNSPR